ncbi:ATP-dependent dsDNA exonuclease, partial [Acinetobacter nosocomialis]
QLRLTFDQQKSELDRLNAHLEQNQKDLTQCQSQIEQWLTLHTAFKQQQFAELLAISTSEEQQLRIVLQQAERQLNEAHSALKTIQEQLAEHLQSQPEIALEQLKTQLQDTLSQLQSNGEQRDQ